MAADDDDGNSKRTFKCCKNKTTNNVFCINCGELFHLSCARVKNIEIINEKFVKCCENENNNLTSNREIELLKEEILLLKNTITDKDTIIKDKIYIINVLEEKIKMKEVRQKPTNTRELQREISTNTTRQSVSNPLQQQQNKGKPQGYQGTNKGKENTYSTILKKPGEAEANASQMDTLQQLSDVQTDKMQELIYIESDKNEKAREFKIITHKKPKATRSNEEPARKCQMGSNEEAINGFRGSSKMAWLYINRIPRDISPENITEYIKKKLNVKTTENIQVRELPTREYQNKCFMIGTNYSYLDELYKSNFWPKNVGYRRFDFKKYKRYQDTEENQGF